MSDIERDLSEVLRDRAAGAPPPRVPPGLGTEVGRRRRTRRAIAATTGVVSVIAVLAVVVALGATREEDEGDHVVAGAPTSRPKRIVAALEDGRVVVMSSKDGSVTRTLASDADVGSKVAVSADGSIVYYTREDPVALCESGPPDQIVSVPIEGGEPLIVASGDQPAISPDGRWLAYLSSGPDQCAPPRQLVIQELDATRFNQELHDLGDAAIVEIWAWSHDSQRLLYQADRELRELTIGADTPARVVRTDDPLPAAYLDSGEIAVVDGSGENAGVSALDPDTNATRRLFGMGNVTILDLEADPAGRHLLLIARPEVGADSLYRWPGRGQPKEFYRGTAWDAAWAPTVDSAAEEIVALTSEGRIVVVDARTGDTERTLATGALTDWSGISADPEGSYVYFNRPSPTQSLPGCLGPTGEVPEVARVSVGGGQVNGPFYSAGYPVTGFHPVVSPDGRFVVFMGAPCGEGLLAGFDLANPGPPGPMGPRTAFNTHLEPLAVSSDLQILLVGVPINETRRQLLLARGDSLVSLRDAGEFTAATLRHDRPVIAEATGDGFRVVAVDGERERVLFRTSGPSPTAMEYDEAGNKLVYVADGHLFRWKAGDGEPQEVADGVLDADWLP